MNLDTRQIRLLDHSLIAVQVLLVAGTLTMSALAFTHRPLPTTAPAAVPTPTTRPTTPAKEHPLAWYSPIWVRDLRQPPFEPKPEVLKEVKAKPTPAAPPNLKLLGTVVEPNDRYGLFADAAGKIMVKRLNETIGEYTIAEIERGKARIKGAAGLVWLSMPDYEARVRGEP